MMFFRVVDELAIIEPDRKMTEKTEGLEGLGMGLKSGNFYLTAETYLSVGRKIRVECRRRPDSKANQACKSVSRGAE